MTESERRRKYRHDRVLIETSRVLSSTFDAAVVYLSGVQLEMLRNVTQYLRRLATYVTEYNPGYYLTPTPEDYDDILAIVSDLEETLMGNPNTLWGYKQVYRDVNVWHNASAGDKDLDSTAVPAGIAINMESFLWKNEDSVCSRVTVQLRVAGENFMIVDDANPAAGQWHVYNIHRTLAAGEVLRFTMYGVVAGDDLYWYVVGTQMEVPA